MVVNIFIEIMANGTETNLIIIGNAYKMLNITHNERMKTREKYECDEWTGHDG